MTTARDSCPSPTVTRCSWSRIRSNCISPASATRSAPMSRCNRRNASREVLLQQQNRLSAHATPPPRSPPVMVTPAAARATQPTTTSDTLRLTPAEIAQRRKEGCCFHCHDMYDNGHKKLCKQLFIIDVVEDDDGDTPLPAGAGDPQISIHVLTGIRPHSDRTMQLAIDTNSVRLTALLDSGSTHNFVDLEAAEQAGIQWGIMQASTLPSPMVTESIARGAARTCRSPSLARSSSSTATALHSGHTRWCSASNGSSP
jgi:hypothetical protein